MLAQKNEGIEKAYHVLKRVSQDDVARMAYEAREAEIRDQLTREKVAREEGIEKGIEQGIEKGIEKGIEQGKEDMVKELLKEGLLSKEQVAKVSKLPLEKIEEIASASGLLPL